MTLRSTSRSTKLRSMNLGSHKLGFAMLLAVFAGWTAPAISDASAPLVEPPIEIDVMELTEITWTPGDPLPPEVARYDGKKVVICGYMHGSVTGDVSEFPLVSDACQCTGELQPHHFVDIDLGDGQTGPIPGSFEVIGRLKVSAKKKDGFITSVYRLRGRLY